MRQIISKINWLVIFSLYIDKNSKKNPIIAFDPLIDGCILHFYTDWFYQHSIDCILKYTVKYKVDFNSTS